MRALPVVRDQAAKSLTDPASVAATSRISPDAISLISWAVLTIGIGQARPRASSVRSIWVSAMACLLRQPTAARSDEYQRSLARVQVKGRDSLDSVDQGIEVGLADLEQVHRQRARLDVDATQRLGLAE